MATLEVVDIKDKTADTGGVQPPLDEAAKKKKEQAGRRKLQNLFERLAQRATEADGPDMLGQNTGHCAEHDTVFQPDEGTSLLLRALSDDLAMLSERRPSLCVDLGCGCGVHAAHLAKLLPPCAVIATDIAAPALVAAKATAACNGVASSVQPLRSNLLTALRDKSVDLVVFHCPYVPCSEQQLNAALERADISDGEATRANSLLSMFGGEGGYGLLRQTLPMLRRVLVDEGLMYYICCSDKRGKGAVPASSCLSKWLNDDAQVAAEGIVATEIACAANHDSNLCVLRCHMKPRGEAAPLAAAVAPIVGAADATGNDVD